MNGCPTVNRSGCAISDCSRLGSRPEVLDAMITSGRVARSIRANSGIFSSSRSGALSCTKSASRDRRLDVAR